VPAWPGAENVAPTRVLSFFSLVHCFYFIRICFFFLIVLHFGFVFTYNTQQKYPYIRRNSNQHPPVSDRPLNRTLEGSATGLG
jgi:hypothetical protein